MSSSAVNYHVIQCCQLSCHPVLSTIMSSSAVNYYDVFVQYHAYIPTDIPDIFCLRFQPINALAFLFLYLSARGHFLIHQCPIINIFLLLCVCQLIDYCNHNTSRNL